MEASRNSVDLFARFRIADMIRERIFREKRSGTAAE
jgi:hypothetical protein